MAQLSSEQARVADQAIAAVEAARAQAQAAIDDEWSVLVWATGAESAHAARAESLRKTSSNLAQLRAERPTLTPERLAGFVELAAASAEVGSILAEARRLTPSGFQAEVVSPTLRQLDPTNLSGPVGKLLLAGAAVLALLLFLKLKD